MFFKQTKLDYAKNYHCINYSIETFAIKIKHINQKRHSCEKKFFTLWIQKLKLDKDLVYLCPFFFTYSGIRYKSSQLLTV